MDREALARIASLTDEEEVAAGTTLAHEGRHEGYFYIVIAGTVEVSRGGGFDALLEADPSVREALEAEMTRRLERIDAEAGSWPRTSGAGATR